MPSGHHDHDHDTMSLCNASRLCMIHPLLHTGDAEVGMVKMQSTLFRKLAFPTETVLQIWLMGLLASACKQTHKPNGYIFSWKSSQTLEQR